MQVAPLQGNSQGGGSPSGPARSISPPRQPRPQDEPAGVLTTPTASISLSSIPQIHSSNPPLPPQVSFLGKLSKLGWGVYEWGCRVVKKSVPFIRDVAPAIAAAAVASSLPSMVAAASNESSHFTTAQTQSQSTDDPPMSGSKDIQPAPSRELSSYHSGSSSQSSSPPVGGSSSQISPYQPPSSLQKKIEALTFLPDPEPEPDTASLHSSAFTPQVTYETPPALTPPTAGTPISVQPIIIGTPCAIKISKGAFNGLVYGYNSGTNSSLPSPEFTFTFTKPDGSPLAISGLQIVNDTLLFTPTEPITTPIKVTASNGVAPPASQTFTVQANYFIPQMSTPFIVNSSNQAGDQSIIGSSSTLGCDGTTWVCYTTPGQSGDTDVVLRNIQNGVPVGSELPVAATSDSESACTVTTTDDCRLMTVYTRTPSSGFPSLQAQSLNASGQPLDDTGASIGPTQLAALTQAGAYNDYTQVTPHTGNMARVVFNPAPTGPFYPNVYTTFFRLDQPATGGPVIRVLAANLNLNTSPNVHDQAPRSVTLRNGSTFTVHDTDTGGDYHFFSKSNVFGNFMRTLGPTAINAAEDRVHEAFPVAHRNDDGVTVYYSKGIDASTFKLVAISKNDPSASFGTEMEISTTNGASPLRCQVAKTTNGYDAIAWWDFAPGGFKVFGAFAYNGQRIGGVTEQFIASDSSFIQVAVTPDLEGGALITTALKINGNKDVVGLKLSLAVSPTSTQPNAGWAPGISTVSSNQTYTLPAGAISNATAFLATDDTGLIWPTTLNQDGTLSLKVTGAAGQRTLTLKGTNPAGEFATVTFTLSVAPSVGHAIPTQPVIVGQQAALRIPRGSFAGLLVGVNTGNGASAPAFTFSVSTPDGNPLPIQNLQLVGDTLFFTPLEMMTTSVLVTVSNGITPPVTQTFTLQANYFVIDVTAPFRVNTLTAGSQKAGQSGVSPNGDIWTCFTTPGSSGDTDVAVQRIRNNQLFGSPVTVGASSDSESNCTVTTSDDGVTWVLFQRGSAASSTIMAQTFDETGQSTTSVTPVWTPNIQHIGLRTMPSGRRITAAFFLTRPDGFIESHGGDLSLGQTPTGAASIQDVSGEKIVSVVGLSKHQTEPRPITLADGQTKVITFDTGEFVGDAFTGATQLGVWDAAYHQLTAPFSVTPVIGRERDPFPVPKAATNGVTVFYSRKLPDDTYKLAFRTCDDPSSIANFGPETDFCELVHSQPARAKVAVTTTGYLVVCWWEFASDSSGFNIFTAFANRNGPKIGTIDTLYVASDSSFLTLNITPDLNGGAVQFYSLRKNGDEDAYARVVSLKASPTSTQPNAGWAPGITTVLPGQTYLLPAGAVTNATSYTAVDELGNPLTVTFSGNPPQPSITMPSATGSHTITLTGTNAEGQHASNSFQVTTSSPNSSWAPNLVLGSVFSGQTYTLPSNFIAGAAASNYTYSVVNEASQATFPATLNPDGTLSVALNDTPGNQTYHLVASDGQRSVSSSPFSLQIVGTQSNWTPAISTGTVFSGATYSMPNFITAPPTPDPYTYTLTDELGTVYPVTRQPDGSLSTGFNPTSGNHTYVLNASDGLNNLTSQTFSLETVGANASWTPALPTNTVFPNQPYVLPNFIGSPPSPDPYTYTLVEGSTVTPVTRNLDGSLNVVFNSAQGAHTYTLQASDGVQTLSSPAFSSTTVTTNTSWVSTFSSGVVFPNQTFSLPNFIASPPSPDPYTYSLVEGTTVTPVSLNVDGTLAVSFSPTPGSHTYTLRASDGAHTLISSPFSATTGTATSNWLSNVPEVLAGLPQSFDLSGAFQGITLSSANTTLKDANGVTIPSTVDANGILTATLPEALNSANAAFTVEVLGEQGHTISHSFSTSLVSQNAGWTPTVTTVTLGQPIALDVSAFLSATAVSHTYTLKNQLGNVIPSSFSSNLLVVDPRDIGVGTQTLSVETSVAGHLLQKSFSFTVQNTSWTPNFSTALPGQTYTMPLGAIPDAVGYTAHDGAGNPLPVSIVGIAPNQSLSLTLPTTPGSTAITLIGTTSQGQQASVQFPVSIADINTSWTPSLSSAFAGQPYTLPGNMVSNMDPSNFTISLVNEQGTAMPVTVTNGALVATFNDAPGTHSYTLRFADTEHEILKTFSLDIAAATPNWTPNLAEVLAGSPQTLDLSGAFQGVTLSAANTHIRDSLTGTNIPISSVQNGQVTATFPASPSGNRTFTIEVEENSHLVTQSFTTNVVAINTGWQPTFPSAVAGQPFELDVSTLLAGVTTPPFFTLTDETGHLIPSTLTPEGKLRLTFDPSLVGSHTLTLATTIGTTPYQNSFPFTVRSPENLPPALGNMDPIEGFPLTTVYLPLPSISDPENDPLVTKAFLDGLEIPWSVDAQNRLAISLAAGSQGNHIVEIRVYDSPTRSVSKFTSLDSLNRLPQKKLGAVLDNLTVGEGDAIAASYACTDFWEDPDLDTLTCTVECSSTQCPAISGVASATPSFSWQPTSDDIGTSTMALVVSDQHGGSDDFAYSITVQKKDAKVSATLSNRLYKPGDTIQTIIPETAFSGLDVASRDYTVSLLNPNDVFPSWLDFNTKSGAFHGPIPFNTTDQDLVFIVTGSDKYGHTATTTVIYSIRSTDVTGAAPVAAPLPNVYIGIGQSRLVPYQVFTAPGPLTYTVTDLSTNQPLADSGSFSLFPGTSGSPSAPPAIRIAPKSGDQTRVGQPRLFKVEAASTTNSALKASLLMSVTVDNNTPTQTRPLRTATGKVGVLGRVEVPPNVFADLIDGDPVTTTAVLVADPDGAVSPVPQQLTAFPSYGFSFKPTKVGTYRFELSGCDFLPACRKAYIDLKVDVDAPIFSGKLPTLNVAEGTETPVSIGTTNFSDPSGPLVFSVQGSSRLTCDAALNCVAKVHPGDSTTTSIKVTATNPFGKSTSRSTVMVTVDRSPSFELSFTLDPIDLHVDEVRSIEIKPSDVSDPDGDLLRLNVYKKGTTLLPEGLSLDPIARNLTITGKPSMIEPITLVFEVYDVDPMTGQIKGGKVAKETTLKLIDDGPFIVAGNIPASFPDGVVNSPYTQSLPAATFGHRSRIASTVTVTGLPDGLNFGFDTNNRLTLLGQPINGAQGRHSLSFFNTARNKTEMATSELFVQNGTPYFYPPPVDSIIQPGLIWSYPLSARDPDQATNDPIHPLKFGLVCEGAALMMNATHISYYPDIDTPPVACNATVADDFGGETVEPFSLTPYRKDINPITVPHRTGGSFPIDRTWFTQDRSKPLEYYLTFASGGDIPPDILTQPVNGKVPVAPSSRRLPMDLRLTATTSDTRAQFSRLLTLLDSPPVLPTLLPNATLSFSNPGGTPVSVNLADLFSIDPSEELLFGQPGFRYTNTTRSVSDPWGYVTPDNFFKGCLPYSAGQYQVSIPYETSGVQSSVPLDLSFTSQRVPPRLPTFATRYVRAGKPFSFTFPLPINGDGTPVEMHFVNSTLGSSLTLQQGNQTFTIFGTAENEATQGNIVISASNQELLSVAELIVESSGVKTTPNATTSTLGLTGGALGIILTILNLLMNLNDPLSFLALLFTCGIKRRVSQKTKDQFRVLCYSVLTCGIYACLQRKKTLSPKVSPSGTSPTNSEDALLSPRYIFVETTSPLKPLSQGSSSGSPSRSSSSTPEQDQVADENQRDDRLAPPRGRHLLPPLYKAPS